MKALVVDDDRVLADLVAFTYYLVYTRWQEAAAAGAVTAGTAAS